MIFFQSHLDDRFLVKLAADHLLKQVRVRVVIAKDDGFGGGYSQGAKTDMLLDLSLARFSESRIGMKGNPIAGRIDPSDIRQEIVFKVDFEFPLNRAVLLECFIDLPGKQHRTVDIISQNDRLRRQVAGRNKAHVFFQFRNFLIVRVPTSFFWVADLAEFAAGKLGRRLLWLFHLRGL